MTHVWILIKTWSQEDTIIDVFTNESQARAVSNILSTYNHDILTTYRIEKHKIREEE